MTSSQPKGNTAGTLHFLKDISLVTSLGRSAMLGAAIFLLAGHGPALAQSAPAPSPVPSAGAAGTTGQPPAGSGPVLTPEQLAAQQEELVKLSQNPVGNIAIVPFQNNFNYGTGPYQRLQYNTNLQPVVPIMLSPKWNLIARAIIPILDNPSSAPPAVCASQYGCGSTFGIGDINPQFYFAPKTAPGRLIWGAGPQFQFPTAAPASLGAGKYSVGPTLVGLFMPGPWVVGVLANNLWSVGGVPTRAAVSSFLIQPFVNYNLKNQWAISSAPTLTANWLATPQQGKWLVPVGAGVVKTFALGSQPMQLGLFYYGNVVRPANAPYGQIRFNWSLLFPVKRGMTPPQ